MEKMSVINGKNIAISIAVFLLLSALFFKFENCGNVYIEISRGSSLSPEIITVNIKNKSWRDVQVSLPKDVFIGSFFVSYKDGSIKEYYDQETLSYFASGYMFEYNLILRKEGFVKWKINLLNLKTLEGEKINLDEVKSIVVKFDDLNTSLLFDRFDKNGCSVESEILYWIKE